MEIDIIEEQKNKLKSLKDSGINVYPNSFKSRIKISEIIQKYTNIEPDKITEETIRIAGRIHTARAMGKASFFNIKDFSGKIQCYLKKDISGETVYDIFKKTDLGDIVGISGNIFKTKTGELTVLVKELILLSKCIRPIPVVREKVVDNVIEKYDEIKDIEFRYRKRYIDLLTNDETKSRFLTRNKVIQSIREYLAKNDFLEVETPMMQSIAGGATALPFITFHNTYKINMFLRVAPELYLKRLLIGGFEKVFEIGKCFRNEGISTRHNPEFTIIEIYQAYADYQDMMQLTEDIITNLLDSVIGKRILLKDGKEINFNPPWQKLKLFDIMKEKTKIDFCEISETGDFLKIAKDLNVKVPENTSKWKIFEHIFDEYVQDNLINPTIIYDYPIQMCPLSKPSAQNEKIAERFELFIGGQELANAYSELNNPEIQAANWEEQIKQKKLGDKEAQEYDFDYVEALEYGMPPAGGLGIGIDRLIMLLTNTNTIKDVILFPFLKPEKNMTEKTPSETK